MHSQSNTTRNELRGAELEFSFYKALGLPLVGMPEGPFALRLEDTLYVRNRGEELELPDFENYENNLLPLYIARTMNAIFYCEPDRVVCRIGAVSAAGDTLTEAAMRAYLRYCAAHPTPAS